MDFHGGPRIRLQIENGSKVQQGDFFMDVHENGQTPVEVQLCVHFKSDSQVPLLF